jgi:hypothetical protein
MVRVEVAVPGPGVMLFGENEHANVLGKPEHDNAIGVFDAPDCIAAVTVTFPDSPVGNVTAVGDALKDMIAEAGCGGAGGGGATVAGQVGA